MKAGKIRVPILYFTLMLFLATMGYSQKAAAHSVKPVTVQSSNDFDGTIATIKKAVSGSGMMVLSEINQGKILSMTGLQVNTHSFFIGNPNVGKQALSAGPSVDLVISLGVNVYEGNGRVHANHFKPSDLFSSFKAKKVKMMSEKLDGKLSNVMKMLR